LDSGQSADIFPASMTTIPLNSKSSSCTYGRRAAGGQLAAAASSASAALAASAAHTPTELSHRDLFATLGKSLDAAA
jgi:hypothetical protein